MQWLAANSQPGLPGEMPDALTAERARSFGKTLLIKRYYRAR